MFISTEILKSALLFVSKEQSRYYLTGIAIEAEADNVRITSTDGHRLFTASIECPDLPKFEAFIIPADAVKRALTGYKELAIEIDPLTRFIGSVSFTPIDGTFPDWRRIAPSELSGKVAQFNPSYIGEFGKAAKLLRADITVHHNGNAPAVVTFGLREDCVGLIMPMLSKAEASFAGRLVQSLFSKSPIAILSQEAA